MLSASLSRRSWWKNFETDAFLVRLGTVCARWRDGRRLPDLRLTGRWLEDAGFSRGREYEVAVEAGKLTIQAI